MTNETKDQGQVKQQNQNPTGSGNPMDKSKNPGQEGMYDPKNQHDLSKKDPSRDAPSQRRDEKDEDVDAGKRRAS